MTEIADENTTLDAPTRDASQHEARSLLRQAIGAVLGNADEKPAASDSVTGLAAPGGEDLHIRLNSGL
jgi:hypothetical protein